MKKYVINGILIFLSLVFLGANNSSLVTVEKNKKQTFSYFKFIGTLGIDEDDNTKWEEITSTEYSDPIIIPCSGSYKGCKIKVNCTVVINGVTRPCCVTVILVGGKKSPVVAQICGVAEIKNRSTIN